jgi:RimK family alpha-L-glutamate ligase
MTVVEEHRRAESQPRQRLGRVRVFGTEANEGTARLVRAWHNLGLRVDLVSNDLLSTVSPDDVVVGRIDVRSTLDGVEPGLLGLLLLERRGVWVLNPASALLEAHDKLRTARTLGAVGLPHPETAAVRDPADPTPAPPVVVKPRFGSSGKDVYRCQSRSELRGCLEHVAKTPWFRRHGAIVQEALPSIGHDLRMLVAGGRVVGAAERVAANGEWRTNVSLGGSVRPFDPDDDIAELARTAAEVIGADFVGIDLAPLPYVGYSLLELNGAIDFDSTYSIRGRDVFTEAARALGLLR